MAPRCRVGVLAVVGLLAAAGCGVDAVGEVDATPDVPAVVTVPPVPTTISPVAVFLSAWQSWTEPERAQFAFFTATPEQQASFAAYVAPPPPPVVLQSHPQAPATRPAPVTTKAPHAATSGGAAPNGFLACVRARESGGNYGAYNPSGAAGAYQMLPATAHNTATHAGRPDLAAKPVSQWSPADQDAMAYHLYAWQGPAPWAGPGC